MSATIDPTVIVEASNLALLLAEPRNSSQFDWTKLTRQMDNIPASSKFRQISNSLQNGIFDLEKAVKGRPGAKGTSFALDHFRDSRRHATEIFLQYKDVSQHHRLEAMKIMLLCGILENFNSVNFMESSLQRSMNILYADADLSRKMDGGFSDELQWFENELKLVARSVFYAVQARRHPDTRLLTPDTPNINELLGQCAKFMHTNVWLDVGGRLVKVFEHTRGCTPLTGGRVLLKTIEHTYKSVDVVTEEIWPTRNLIQTGVDCYGIRAMGEIIFAHEGFAVAKKRISQVRATRMEVEKLGKL